MKLTGAQALIKSLEMEGTEVMFGLPGGAILPVYDPLIDSSIRHILVRHEQGAGHMAEGYAHATGRPGVAMVTSGPAATNIVTPLCDAYMDSIPLVVITGQVPYAVDRHRRVPGVRHRRHHHARHQAQLADHRREDVPRVDPRGVPRRDHRPARARCSSTCRRTCSNQTMDWDWPEGVDLPGYKPNTKGHPKQIKDAARLMGEAQPARDLRRRRHPQGASGRGAAGARRASPASRLSPRSWRAARSPTTTSSASACRACTATTPRSRRCSGPICSSRSGSRFDDRVTGKVDAFAPDAKIIHVDIDPAELGKVRRPDVPIVGDCRLVIEELVKAVRAEQHKHEFPSLDDWHAQLREWQEQLPAARTSSSRTARSSRSTCIDMLRDNTPDDTIVASGVGQHQMWTSQHWKFNHPYTFVNSGGLGTMGFAVPAAIGAKVGKPERMVWAVDGDGCFQMTAQELVTASAERIPVKVAILNNAYLGMVRQWQELFYEERYSEVYLSPDLPDYVKWAEAMGCVGLPRRHPRRRGARRSRRRTRSTTARWSSTSAPTTGRRCTRWSRPARRTTTSSSIPPTTRTERGDMPDATPHPQRARREQVRRAVARRRACSRGAGSTSCRSRSARPRTSASAG